MDTVKIGRVYRHFKGNYYFVENRGLDSETKEWLVVYKALYKSDNFPEGQIWCRPLKMWNDLINGKPRFEKIIDNDIKL